MWVKRWPAPGSSRITARAAFRSATCFRTWPSACRRPGHRPLDGRNSPSTPTPTISCTPAPACKDGRAWALDHATDSAASARNLPGFVVLNGGLIPPGGLDNFNSGFLPATLSRFDLQAGRYRRWPTSAGRNATAELQQQKLALLRQARSRLRATRSATSTPSNRRSPTTSSPFACRPPCPI